MYVIDQLLIETLEMFLNESGKSEVAQGISPPLFIFVSVALNIYEVETGTSVELRGIGGLPPS